MPLLTKSKYLNGLQCPKYMWTAFNDKDKLPEIDEATQYRFDQGHMIGQMAKQWFPDGIDIKEDDFIKNIHETKAALSKRKPVFEAGIRFEDLYSRADILSPVGEDEWDIIEVKSATKVKDVNIHDLSFQKHVYHKFGLKIRKCFLMHINSDYVRQGELDYKQLLAMDDVTDQVEEAIEGIEQRITEMFNTINFPTCPDTPIGKQCTDPYPCPLIPDLCWASLPEDSVFDLYYGGKKSWDLYDQGILSIKDIPDDYDLNDKQQVQMQSTKTGQVFTNPGMIKEFLDNIRYPLYFLDFETINPAVPLYDNSHPYQQIPFQFSLHIVTKDDVTGKPITDHKEFLHLESTDPRPAFMAALKENLGTEGSIIAFNQSFETGRIRDAAQVWPEYQNWYDNLIPRFMDLMIPFKAFHYHDPKQKGSNSLKAVLPALTGKGYDGLDIADGGDASLKYQELQNNKKLTAAEKEKIRVDLLKYCGLDTEGMIWILEKLRGV
ncbi:DUF2779 domain-containing protein [Nanoarchaeota archaeon]